MKRPWMVRIGLFFGIIFLLWGSLLIGVNFGNKVGRSEYHNEYMRQIQMELSRLNEAIERGDMEEIQIFTNGATALAMSAGDYTKFHETLEANRQPITIETGVIDDIDFQWVNKQVAGYDIWAEVLTESSISADWTREEFDLRMLKRVGGNLGGFVGRGQSILRLPPVENDSYGYKVRDGVLIISLSKQEKEYLRLRLSTINTIKQ